MGARLRTLVFVSVALVCGARGAAAAQEPSIPANVREITSVREHLYLARDGDYYTIFLVTPDGVVLADPLNVSFATWLKGELASRFGVPVRYVVLSHHHFDWAEGASVFAETAPSLAHESFNGLLRKWRELRPPFLADLDKGNKQFFVRRDLPDEPRARQILMRDRNGNGTVTARELYEHVTAATRGYKSHETIALSGSSVDLFHRPSPHASDLTVVLFRAQGVLFAAEPPPVTSIPFNAGRYRTLDALAWLRTITPIQFDVLVTGSGASTSRRDLIALQQYLEALVEHTVASVDEGRRPQQIPAASRLAALAGGAHDAAFAVQLSQLLRELHVLKVDIFGAGVVSAVSGSTPFCTGFATCQMPTRTGAGMAGMAISRGSVGLALESTTNQRTMFRTAAGYDEEFALRQTRVSVLARYGPPPHGRWSFNVLGGYAFTAGDEAGIFRVRGGTGLTFGRAAIAERLLRGGLTGGVDLGAVLTGRIAIVAPVRVTRIFNAPPTWPGNFDLSIGAGARVRLVRWAR